MVSSRKVVFLTERTEMEKSFHIGFNYKDFSASLEMRGKKKLQAV